MDTALVALHSRLASWSSRDLRVQQSMPGHARLVPQPWMALAQGEPAWSRRSQSACTLRCRRRPGRRCPASPARLSAGSHACPGLRLPACSPGHCRGPARQRGVCSPCAHAAKCDCRVFLAELGLRLLQELVRQRDQYHVQPLAAQPVRQRLADACARACLSRRGLSTSSVCAPAQPAQPHRCWLPSPGPTGPGTPASGCAAVPR